MKRRKSQPTSPKQGPRADDLACLTQAFQHHQAGQLDAAAKLYQDFLKQYPNHAEARGHLGQLLLQSGNPAPAAKQLAEAVKRMPQRADLHFQLGNAYAAMKQVAQAETAYRTALQQAPGTLQIVAALAALLHGSDRSAAAANLMAEACKEQPQNPTLHCYRGVFLRGAGNLDGAVDAYRQAIALQPDLVEAHYNLGNLYQETGRHSIAIDAFRHALAEKPNFVEAQENMGNSLMETRQFDQALSAYQAVLEARPEHAGGQANLGNALLACQRASDAMNAFREAIRLDPQRNDTCAQLVFQMQRHAQWDGLDTLQQTVLENLHHPSSPLAPFPLLPMDSSAEQQLLCARTHAASTLAPISAQSVAPAPHPGWPGRRLRIGYLSADFRRHPVAFLIQDLLATHDRQRFEIFGYAYGVDDGHPIRAKLATDCDHFYDIRDTSFAQAAAKIRDDGIDILVDLSGYTKGSRLEILAHRPAPLNVTWLGYAGTLGSDFIDYIIADPVVLPSTLESGFAEAPLRLPDCFLPNHRNHSEVGIPLSRAEYGLPDAGFVFCSFNHTYKTTPQLFSLWMELLQELPESVLWLAESDPQVAHQLGSHAQRHGIDPNRLIFAQRVDGQADYLARFRVANLFLDTLPYNAHATTSDLLWAGCPMVTCAGNTFAARVAASLLNAAGVPELITHNLTDYRTLALALARDPQRLAALRARLTQGRDHSALFDAPRHTRHLEAGYEAIWQRHIAGQPPGPITITPHDR